MSINFIMNEEPSEVYVENLRDALGRLPPKSRKKYIVVYQKFIMWKHEKGLEGFSEDIFLTYFEKKSKLLKPSSLWCIFSMLKTTMMDKHNIDLKEFKQLLNFLRKASKGFKSKKANVLTNEHIEKFLDDAPDFKYLATKVVLIFGVSGSCLRQELAEITTDDIKEYNDMYLVRITNEQNATLRTFTIDGNHYKIVKKYEALRVPRVGNSRFFQNYQNGICTNIPIGMNKYAAMPKTIATFLGLPNPNSYNGHSYRKISTSLQHVQRD